MGNTNNISAAVIDYGLGNLFSIKQACNHVGMNAVITSNKNEITAADIIFLPGVGAFGHAMKSLNRLNLNGLLYDLAMEGKPFIGICLGMQLLMSESEEFGRHKGLGIIDGTVVRFSEPKGEKGVLKVPQVGWNKIYRFRPDGNMSKDPWSESPLNDIDDGEFMYFVHSYYVKPDNPSVITSMSDYGDIMFCSSFCYRNIFASQFHPERSGLQGLHIYRNILKWILSISKNQGDEVG
jgi:glutamine amidotransferase